MPFAGAKRSARRPLRAAEKRALHGRTYGAASARVCRAPLKHRFGNEASDRLRRNRAAVDPYRSKPVLGTSLSRHSESRRAEPLRSGGRLCAPPSLAANCDVATRLAGQGRGASRARCGAGTRPKRFLASCSAPGSMPLTNSCGGPRAPITALQATTYTTRERQEISAGRVPGERETAQASQPRCGICSSSELKQLQLAEANDLNCPRCVPVATQGTSRRRSCRARVDSGSRGRRETPESRQCRPAGLRIRRGLGRSRRRDCDSGTG